MRSKVINKIQQHKEVIIYWGNQENSICPDSFELEKRKACESIALSLGVDAIVALKQIHANIGLVANEGCSEGKIYAGEGDFIITQKKSLGLILFTADCIPLVVYNSANQSLGVLHAGWKGAVTNIVQNFFKNNLFKSNRDKIKIFFGPAALDCCYEVQEDFLDHFSEGMKQQCFVKRDGKIFYNNSFFVRLILKNLGILERNIYTNYNICTICSVQYCSYRRDKQSSQRNVTVALFR